MSSVEDKLDKLMDKVGDMAERMVRMETRSEIMERDVQSIKEQDVRQNELLAEHIRGVETQAERLDEEKAARKKETKELDGRVEILEEWPKLRSKLFSGSKKVAYWIIAIASAAGIVAGLISKYM